MKKHIYIVILLAACLGSCGNKYYEFSDAEEYMLPYEANDSVQYCANTECGYLTVTRYNRYVGDDAHMLPATHSFDVKTINFDDKTNLNRMLWIQDKADNNFNVEVSTNFRYSGDNLVYSNNFHTAIDFVTQPIHLEKLIRGKRFKNVFELNDVYEGTDSQFFFNSTEGFLMLTRKKDTIFFGETLNSDK